MRTITFILLAFVINAAKAQQVITVVRGGQSFFHYDVSQLATLVSTTSPAHTMPGDTVILPGGTISTPTFTIDKPLTIIGAGTLESGTGVTGMTILDNTPIFPSSNAWISIVSTASGSSIHGIIFQDNVRFAGSENNTPSFHFEFTRCRFISAVDLSTFGINSWSSAAHNVIFKHCQLNSGIGNGSSTAPVNLQLNNCYISGNIYITGTAYASNTFVNQCIVLGPHNHSLNNGVVFINNIFVKNTGSYSFPNSGASFHNNLFGTSAGAAPTFGGGVTQSGNQATVNSLIFQNVTDFNAFNENFDYHLANGSPAIGMGQGGYDVGVYDGPPGNPWKEHAIPFNPHWQQLLPMGSLGTTQGGTIGVTIQGAAQQN